MPQTKNDMVIMGANSESFQIPSLHSSLLIQRVYNILIYCWSLNKLHFNKKKSTMRYQIAKMNEMGFIIHLV